MPQSMFQSMVCPQGGSTRKWYMLPVSFMIHTAILIVCIVVPLVAVDVLPTPRSMMAFVAPPPLPTAPPVAVQNMPATAPIAADNRSAAPVEAPPGIRPESGLIIEPEQSNLGTPGVIDGIGVAALLEPPPPPPPPLPVKPMTV